MSSIQHLPKKIRISAGSAIVLGLLKGLLDTPPTTVYMLTYRGGKCLANCAFCPQARSSTSRADMLSRVTWPAFPTTLTIEKIAESGKNGIIRRACIQTLNYPKAFQDILCITKSIHSSCNLPISLSCQPLRKARLKQLKEAGVGRISIALDAATEKLFVNIKGASRQGPYEWNRQRRALEDAVEVFGRGHVNTHLIAGLGETEKEMTEAFEWCTNLGVYPSLFAFTPILGTALENKAQPAIEAYRRIQLARYLIVTRKTTSKDMKFDEKGKISSFGMAKNELEGVISRGEPFRTSGCPDCNRPYYNERPGGPLYNFPRKPLLSEIYEINRHLAEG